MQIKIIRRVVLPEFVRKWENSSDTVIVNKTTYLYSQIVNDECEFHFPLGHLILSFFQGRS